MNDSRTLGQAALLILELEPTLLVARSGEPHEFQYSLRFGLAAVHALHMFEFSL